MPVLQFFCNVFDLSHTQSRQLIQDNVYHIHRKEMIQHLSQIMAFLELDATVQKRSPTEKRILITQAIGEEYKKFCNADAFE